MEENQGFGRKLPLIIIIIIAVAAVVLSVWTTQQRQKEEAETARKEKARQIRAERLVDRNISELVGSYLNAYASGNVKNISQYAKPMTEIEKDYIRIYSGYIKKFDSVSCSRVNGPERASYIVTVTANETYRSVDTKRYRCFVYYVKRDVNGFYYIDNVYSTFNSKYRISAVSASVRNAIEKHENTDDVQKKKNRARTSYKQMKKDRAFLKMESQRKAEIRKWKKSNKKVIKTLQKSAASQESDENASESGNNTNAEK